MFGSARREMIDHIPHCRRLGMEVVEIGPRRATVRLPYRDELVGDPVRRVVFGGVITTLLDHAGGLAVFASLAELKAIATLDLRIDYLRRPTAGATSSARRTATSSPPTSPSCAPRPGNAGRTTPLPSYLARCA
jgi:uncharacterized protein (TIGR00369 family)